MSQLTAAVDFNQIRYANCWEDADILLSSLQLQPGASVLCVASAGDNALALLSTQPKSVLGVDLSAPQLYLTELKQRCFQQLQYQELLMLLGVQDASAAQREQLFHKVATVLSDDARAYWQQHIKMIGAGIIYHGKFEYYFRFFRRWLLPLVHRKKTITALLAPKPDQQQQDFYDTRWNTWPWQLLMHIFFSRQVMGKYGRDPEFLRHVAISVPRYIRQKAEQHLQSSLSTRNYFLHFMLTGKFGNGLPFYLREENFEAIRQHADRLSLTQADVGKVIKQQNFDVCCLSNIFEYFSPAEFETTVADWSAALKTGTQLAFWNLMAPRSFSDTAAAYYRRQTAIDYKSDKGFFYSRYLLEERI